jgi:hypothetical protein
LREGVECIYFETKARKNWPTLSQM